MSDDAEISVLGWLTAVAGEMSEKQVAPDDRHVLLMGDEPRLLLVELADYKAGIGDKDAAKVLRNVILSGNPAAFIDEAELEINGLLIKAAIH